MSALEGPAPDPAAPAGGRRRGRVGRLLQRLGDWRRAFCAPEPGERSHVPSPAATAVHVIVLELAVAGAVALQGDLAVRWRIVVFSLVGAVVALRLLPLRRAFGCPGKAVELAGAMAGLVVISVFALLGVDAGLALVGVGAVTPWIGLPVGAVIVAVVGRISLEPFWTGNTLRHPWRPAVGAALLLVVGPFAWMAIAGLVNGDGSSVGQRRVVAQLDVVVLQAGAASAADPPPVTRLGDWRVVTWTGVVHGRRIAWAGGRAPSLTGEADADRVLLLLPPARDDGAPVRWMRLADRVEPRATPTYALLRQPRPAQLRAWRRPLSGVTGRNGDARDLAAVGGPGLGAAELGVRVATQAPTAAADLALAIAHRPVLGFDGGDRVHRPLDVDAMFATRAVSMCEAGQKIRSRCEEISAGDQLQTGYNHLAFDTKKVAAADIPSRIYVHVTHVSPAAAAAGGGRAGQVDLDYWWYLPDNPARSGSGAFCGPGFEIGGVTCFDHQSDWEGVTVILDAGDPAGAPLAVDYAEHDGTVRYSWPALQRLWTLTRAKRFVEPDATSVRPLVYSARGTHASYPIACEQRSCPRNAVPGIRDTGALDDESHDGLIPWEGDEDSHCAGACVVALPTRRGGSQPAGWSAWPGRWGTANCVLGVVCASAQPPQSPGEQPRYRRPWCTGGAFDVTSDGRFTGPKPVPRCASPEVATGALVAGRRLVVVGDSYASGEGAGDYEAGTDSKRDTCHRSRNAWARVLAEQRRLRVEASVACSGARVQDVLTGRPAGEPERQRSQIGRIPRDAQVVVLTIGGNDLGFRSVLEHCIALDCVAWYHRASGDVIDARIDALARRLPPAYRAIQAAAPRARVIVVDYPRLFPSADGGASPPNCAAGRAITPAEGDYLNEKIQRADVAILDAARQAGVSAIDVSTALAGGELSCTGPQWLNHASAQRTLLPASFHPNAQGQERLAAAVARGLGELSG